MSQIAGHQKAMKNDDSDYGKPIVQVEAIERGREKDTGYTVPNKEKEPEQHFHEGETIKTSYTVEEDTPSLYQRLKSRLLVAEYQVRSMVADYTKRAPEKTNPGNDKKELKGKGKSGHKSSDGSDKLFSSKGTFGSETTEDQKVRAGEEMGTGYETSSDEGGSSVPSSATGDTAAPAPTQPEALFKPAKAKDDSDITLEELRASKLNQNSSAEDVKAPGILTRMKEEVDAITDTVTEELGLKGK
ncbi:hypothetical protein R1sor_020242 [Riccia sorocarpa]|uniref:Uncharacterized protein n=1 Tax=Riccia sorocarpa TaxID=122646 RepID=A0ABD3IIH4_9MARC